MHPRALLLAIGATSERACPSDARGSGGAQSAAGEGKAERRLSQNELFKALLAFQDPLLQPVVPLYVHFVNMTL